VSKTKISEAAPPATLPKDVKDAPPDVQSKWLHIRSEALDYAKKAKIKGPLAYALKLANAVLGTPASDAEAVLMPASESCRLIEADGDAPAELEIEIFRAGSYGWKGTYTIADVEAMAADYVPEFHEAPVTMDHECYGKALGWVRSLAVTGEILTARIHNLADEFVEMLRSGAIKKRSVEIYRQFEATGRPYLRALTFLGAGAPEVKGLADINFSEADKRADAGAFVQISYGETAAAGGDATTTDGEPTKIGGRGAVHTQQAVRKQEADGSTYPRQAYAHAPDPAAPETWALRMWESPEGPPTMRALGRCVAALSPGGLSGRRVELSDEDAPLARARLRAEFRRLDKESDMPRWIEESGEAVRFAECLTAEFEEAADGAADKRWPVTIVTPGLNRRGTNLYTEDALRDGVSRFQGAQVFADHPSPEDERRGGRGSVKNLVGVLKDVFWDDERHALRGWVHATRDWFQELLVSLREADALDSMHLSIKGFGASVRQKIAGKMVNVIRTIQEIRSVDAVTAGAAGGEFEEFAEADFDENDIMLVDVAAIESRRPDLFDEIRARCEAEQTEEAIAMAQTVEELQEALSAAEGERDKAKTELEATEKTRDELQAKLSEKERAEARATVAATVDDVLTNADPALSETAAARVRRTFADRSDLDGLDEAVKAEVAEMHKIADEAKGPARKPAIEGMGEEAPDEGDVTKADEAANKEMVDRFRRGMERDGKKTAAEVDAACAAYAESL
jgi:hypothetical protein